MRSIKVGEIVGYTYEIYYDSSFIHSSDDEFEEENEAREDAEDYIDMQIDLWKADGAWHEDDSRELFEINIIDIMSDEDDEEDEED